MTSKLGVYWSVSHRRPQDYDYFKRLNPSVMKIMDGGDVDYAWIKANLPDSLVVARIHALSEQHADMLKEPMETGIRHAREWDEHQARLGFDRAKTLILGVNEPHIWEPGVAEALRIYTINFCEAATRRGLRVGAMQLSVGWPNNDGPDTPPNWSLWHGVDNAIRRNNGALVCHEYWADNGPSENWGWWAGRVLKCPWQVPIVVGETGVDMFVKDASVNHAQRGWLGRMDPQRYAQELAEYVARMSEDSRFVGCAVFASDFASREWFSFDVEPAYQAILATPIHDAKPDAKPFDLHMPAIEVGEGPTPPAKPATLYVSVTAGANLRDAPVATPVGNNVLAKVPYGDVVEVYGSTVGNDGMYWSRVRYNGFSGWIRGDLLSAEPPVAPTPAPSEPVGDKWQRSRAFVARWEGGYQNVHNDTGNWTGGKVGVGELKGTNFGISAASYPDLDIRNLSLAQADDIYFRDYWQASGADKLPWPLCLLILDTAVLHGVGTARKWQAEVGPNPYAFAAKRLRVYTKMSNWDFWGKAWVNRVADLLEEMSK